MRIPVETSLLPMRFTASSLWTNSPNPLAPSCTASNPQLNCLINIRDKRLTATGIIQPIHLLIRQRNPQTAPDRSDHRRVIPLLIIRLPIMQILGFPERVVSGPKRPPVTVEFVRKDEIPCFARFERCVGIGGCGGVVVD